LRCEPPTFRRISQPTYHTHLIAVAKEAKEASDGEQTEPEPAKRITRNRA